MRTLATIMTFAMNGANIGFLKNLIGFIAQCGFKETEMPQPKRPKDLCILVISFKENSNKRAYLAQGLSFNPVHR